MLNFGVGGTTFISINGRWRFMLGYTTLKTDYSAAALGAPKTTKQIIRQFTIPRINNKSIIQLECRIINYWSIIVLEYLYHYSI